MRWERLILLISVIFIVAFFITSTSSQQYYDDYSDVMLVCNSDSSVSQEICSYFIEKRIVKDFNNSNIVNLTNVSASETISDTEFEKIFNQINETLQSSGEINYIVTTKGVPLRTGNRAVDSKLMARFGSTNNYYAKEDIFTQEVYDGYLVTRLTGNNVNDTKRMLDNSDLAISDGLSGEFIINCYGGYGNHNCISANSTISSNGYATNYNDTGFVKNTHNLSGYVSWGSNAFGIGYSGSNANSSAWNLSFKPGALAETYVSTSARTFNTYPWSSGQSLISDMIKYNVTGVKGYVYEPYLYAITNVDILWSRYLSGYNLADSYYMSSSQRDWMDVVIGDPKTYVIPNTLVPSITLNNRLNGERMSSGSIINFTIQSSKFSSLDNIWYSTNDSVNLSLNGDGSYDVNTSGLSDANYNFTIYANDSLGNMGTKMYSFKINSTEGEVPDYDTFDGNETTDIKTLADRTNIPNLVLEKELAGKVMFLENVNVSGLDIDGNIEIKRGYISINSSELSELNVSANITFYNLNLSEYDSSFLKIMKDGNVCTDCYNFTPLTAETVIFNVSSFSEYYISGEYLTGCANITQSGNYYLLNDISSPVIHCMNISATNVTLDGQGHLINFSGSSLGSVGIYGEGAVGGDLTIENISISGYNRGISFSGINSGKIYDTVLLNYVNITFDDSGELGAALDNVTKMIMVYNSNFDNTRGIGFFAFVRPSFNYDWVVYAENVTASNNYDQGFYLSGTNQFTPRFFASNIVANYNGAEGIGGEVVDSSFENITVNYNNVDGLYLDAINTTFKNISAKFNGDDGIIGTYINSSFENIYLEGNGNWGGLGLYGGSKNNIIKNLHAIDEAGGTIVDDSGISFINYFMYNSSHATINFTDQAFLKNLDIAGNIAFPGYINLSLNYIYVNSTALPELNVSANLALRFSPNEFSIPYIAKDSIACVDCYNFTSLAADNVEFNISSFSSYSLVENDTQNPNLTYISKSVTTNSINVTFNASDNGRLKNCSLTVNSLGNSTTNISNPNNLFVSGLSAGTQHTGTIECFDYADNSNSSSIDFTTNTNPSEGGSSSSSGGSPSREIEFDEDSFNGSNKIEFGFRNNFSYSGEEHHILLKNINRATQEATIEISSKKQLVTIKEGENRSIDITEDGVLDIILILNKIYEDSVAIDLSIQEISKETISLNQEENLTSTENKEIIESKNLMLAWILTIIAAILFLLGIYLFFHKGRNKLKI